MNTKKVNLFIIGAPKCGTTSLANYLNQSEDILLSDTKEPHFFKGDLLGPYNNYINKIETYQNLFLKHEKKDSKYWLDASVWYYSNSKIAEEIYNYNPDAKIIFIARNPKEAIKSLFKHRVAALNEDQTDINKALELISLRKEGKAIPSTLKTTQQGLFYIENYKYAEKIECFQKLFQNNLKIVLFEEFTSNPEELLNEIIAWLDISVWGYSFNTRFNVAKPGRSQKITYFLHKISPKIKRILKRNRILQFILQQSSRFFKTKKLILEFNSISLKMMKKEMNGDIERFQSVIGKDLTQWKI